VWSLLAQKVYQSRKEELLVLPKAVAEISRIIDHEAIGKQEVLRFKWEQKN